MVLIFKSININGGVNFTLPFDIMHCDILTFYIIKRRIVAKIIYYFEGLEYGK